MPQIRLCSLVDGIRSFLFSSSLSAERASALHPFPQPLVPTSTSNSTNSLDAEPKKSCLVLTDTPSSRSSYTQSSSLLNLSATAKATLVGSKEHRLERHSANARIFGASFSIVSISWVASIPRHATYAARTSHSRLSHLDCKP